MTQRSAGSCSACNAMDGLRSRRCSRTHAALLAVGAAPAQRAQHQQRRSQTTTQRTLPSSIMQQQDHIKDPAKLREVKRVLYGCNQGAPVPPLALPPEAAAAAAAAHRPFDLQAYAFAAAPEELREPRVVRIGLVQNAVVAPSTAPFSEQRKVRCVRLDFVLRAGGVCGGVCGPTRRSGT